ncbi:hypothetical protein EHV23_06240 [Lautropia dentalis]|uniref:Uncharacterized protein n=1 Tax=Lautropia dentalis TaxID=2490857 RepID=A0A3R8MSY2_9BURK|nr:hypothetical protein [Lautropia dentalis]RRN45743.1 hypothetical protein EHV23_06240 [Lautropia dentalis]
MSGSSLLKRCVGGATSLAVLGVVLTGSPGDALAAPRKAGRGTSAAVAKSTTAAGTGAAASSAVGAGVGTAAVAGTTAATGVAAGTTAAAGGVQRGDPSRRAVSPAEALQDKNARETARETPSASLRSGIDFGTFRTWANEDLARLDGGYRIPASAQPEDSGASPWRIARILLKDGLLAMVFVDPQRGHVVRIMSMVSPLGDIETIIRNAVGGILLASAADGEQGERTVQPAMMQLFQRLTDEALNTSGLKGEVEDGFVREGVRYTVKVSKTMGFWFTAELEGMKKL